MLPTRFKSAFILSVIIAMLAVVASAGGIFMNGLYRDNDLVTSGWFGNDLVTLLIAVPILVAASILALRGSGRAQLVWMGMLDYMLYNYAFYLFGSRLNSFFLLYVALFTLSIFALIFGLAGLDVKGISGQFQVRTPVRVISMWLALLALFLGGFWIAQSVEFIITGEIPVAIEQVNWPTNVIAALDLSTVVSASALGAVWLWQRRPWGYVLAAIVNVKGAVYMLALAATTLAAFRAGALDSASVAGLWVGIGLGCLLGCGFLLGNFRSVTRPVPST